MKRENRTPDPGLILGNPRVIAAEGSLPKRFFYYFIILILGLTGAYGCFYTAFSIPVYWRIVILCAVLFSAAFTLLFLTRRYRFLVATLSGICLGALFFLKDGLLDFLKDGLIQGFIHTVNAVILAYAPKSNYDFKTLPEKTAGIGEITVFNTVFAIAVLLLITLFMAWLLIRRKNTFWCILLTLPFAGAPLLYVIIPHYAAVTSLLVFWAFLLLNAPAQRSGLRLNRKKHGSKKGRAFRKGFIANGSRLFYADGNRSGHPASLILLPVLTACLILVSVVFPKQSFQRSDFLNDIRKGVISGVNWPSLFRFGGVAGNTNRVNLQVAGNISFSGETVLRVKSATNYADYLKGFVGSVYTGQSWEALPDEDEQELNQILNEWKVQNFPHLFSQLPYDFIADNEYEYDLTVQNIAGNPRCVYMPYGLISGPESLSGIDFVNDGFLRSGNSIFGTKEYSLKAISLAETTSQLLKPIIAMTSLDYYYETDVSEGTVVQFVVLGSAGQMDEWTIPDEILETLPPEQRSFAQSAQEYNSFVYSHYTQLPEELRDRLDQYRQECSLDTDNYPWPYQLAHAIISQVQSKNTYTLSPGTTPAGRDFAEYFLFENHRGYCMHFASAAAVLLRSAGIPARYVEGYTVSPDDFESPDGWANVPDSRAHAWVEIYLSGIGWIPVEATPGAQNGIIDHEAAALANATAAEASEEAISGEPKTSPESTATPHEEENGEADPSEPLKPDEGTSAEGSSVRKPNTVMRVFAAVAALGLLIAVLQINRRLRIALRNKSYLQADYNQAVLAVYDYIQKLHPYIKSVRNVPVKLPKDLYDLVLKARFSQHMLTEQEVRKLRDHAEGLADQVREKAPLIRRFAGKYMAGLF